MKFETKVTKLLEQHEPQQIIDQIIRQVGWEKVLLAVSNKLVFKSGTYGGDRAKKKLWMKHAKAVHGAMEDAKAEIDKNNESL